MKQYLNSERGYTMLIVVGTLVIFTIIGMSLMTLNLQSLTKNESRESNIQAKDLSVKGIDYVLAEIEYKMMKQNINIGSKTYGPLENGLRGEAFLEKFLYVLNSYKCDTNTSELQNTQTGKTTYCITKTEEVPKSLGYQQYVYFKSIGTSNSKEHLTETKIKLGANVNNDAFNYALMTYDPGYDDNQLKKLLFNKTGSLTSAEQNSFNYYKNTKGNIDLHGGLKVAGNIRADKGFYISDQSRYKGTSVPSILPYIEGEATGKSSRIEIKDLDTAPTNSRAILKDSLETKLPSSNIKNSTIPLGSGSTLKGTFEKAGDVEVDFDIVKRVNAAAYDYTSTNVDTITTQGVTWEPNYGLRTSISNEKFLAYNLDTTRYNKAVLKHYDVTTSNQRKNANWFVSRTNKFNSIAFPNNLHLKYGTAPANTNPILHVSDYAYIGKDLIIGLDNANEVNFDAFNNILAIDVLGLLGGLEALTNMETPVELNGTFYVDGDLIISGARLTGNATFFVKGNTYIAFSEIGVPPVGQALEQYTKNLQSDSNISIFSHGPMNISYLSNNHNNYAKAYRKDTNNSSLLEKITDPLSLLRDDYTRSIWNGHLHSDTYIKVDASTSYMTLNGSISSPKIFATSIKGRAEPSCINLGTGLDYTVRFLLNDVLSYLLGTSLTSFLENLLLGDKASQPDQQMNRISSNSGLGSNCFQKADLQNTAEQPFSNFTASLLNLNLLPWGNNQYYPLEPRLIINYSQDPKINYLRYVTIDSLETPKEISRE